LNYGRRPSYEGSELEEPEIARHVKKYTKAWDTLDTFFEEYQP
jgi:hypothetical protein